MKTISAPALAALAAEVIRPCYLIQITRRDGQAYYFTDHDDDLTVGVQTYTAAVGMTRMAVARDGTMSVDNSQLTGLIDGGALSATDLRAGLFDYADLRILMLPDWNDTTIATVQLGRGSLGEMITTPSGGFMTEVRGMNQILATTVGEVYTPSCRADLGDSRCKIPIAPTLVARSTAYVVGAFVRAVVDGAHTDSRQYGNVIFRATAAGTTASGAPTWNTTVGGTTTDGSVTWTTVTAWTRSGVVASTVSQSNFLVTITESRFVDGWFTFGTLTWETGANAGRSIEVINSQASPQALFLFLPMPNPIAAGDRFRVYAGCDKQHSTCKDRFANIINRRAEDFVPGGDWLLMSPGAFL